MKISVGNTMFGMSAGRHRQDEQKIHEQNRLMQEMETALVRKLDLNQLRKNLQEAS